MLILNETNYSNGKVTLYDNENNVVRNGHVEVYVGTNKVSTFSLDVYGQGTPSITAGVFYRFEVFDSVGELVSILEPVSFGESSGGGVTPAALEAETVARIAADNGLQEQINSKADKSYVDDKFGQITYDKRVFEAKINEETARAKESEKANADAIEALSGSIDDHVSDKSNPHEVTAEQIGAAKSTDLAAYVKKAGDTMTGRLTVQTAGGDPAKYAEGALVAKMTAAANKTGVSTNGSVFAGDLDNTNSQFVGTRRKLFTGDKVAARFQIFASAATSTASQGTAAFMQVDYTSKATIKSIFEFGHNYGTKEDNWGTMTFGDETKNIAYKEDFDTALNDTSESAPQTKAVKAAIDSHDEKIKAVTDLIPTAATPANQLADKAYVDFGVEQMAAKYLSATADGQPFSSYAQFQQGVFYYGGEVTEPTKNDYALVNGDETHDNAVTRYVFTTEWNFQYVVNNSPLNAEQLAALNSTINASKVGNYDAHIADTTKHITEAERTKWNGYETGKANATHTHTASQVSGLATVATTGSYSDLTGKPTIPPAITVDSAMSSTSTNPVQNKVVNAAIDGQNFINSKSYSTIQSSLNKYIQVNVETVDFTNLLLLADVTDFESGTIKNSSSEHTFFNGLIENIRYAGYPADNSANIVSHYGYTKNSVILQTNNSTCKPCVVQCNFTRFEPVWIAGTWIRANVGSVTTLNASASSRNYCEFGVTGGQQIYISTGIYSADSSEAAYIFVDSNNVVKGISSAQWANELVTVPSGATKLYVQSAYQKTCEVGLKTEIPTYYLAIRFSGWNAGRIFFRGKFYSNRTTSSPTYRSRAFIMKVCSGGYGFSNSAIPAAYTIVKNASTLTNESTSAEKLLTPCYLGVNLARTAASTFDGSANQLEIPVKGKLPDDNIASASTWNGKQDALSFTTPAEITEILGGLE